ncbi:MAG: sigma-70 family RNA polymerase sigma factor [Bacteroidia bacterium]
METYSHLYQQLRPKLFALAYRMTGNVAESKDILQEVWANFLENAAQVTTPENYLCRAVCNRTMSFLKKQQVIREHYKGIYLPEPIFSETLGFEVEGDISMGFWLLLEKLNSLERAIFLLRESFDFEYQELAEIFEIQAATCRQHFHRAKEKLASAKKRFSPTSEERKYWLSLFEQASQGEIENFIHALKEDVAIYSDGGGKVSAALNPIFGKENCGKMLRGFAQKKGADFEFRLAEINHCPAYLFYDKNSKKLDSVFVIELDNQGITSIYIVRNPDKLGL